MGYTHYFGFNTVRGEDKEIEEKYQRAVSDCQRIIRRYYAENGGLSGYTAHTTIGAYGGIQVNGAGDDGCEPLFLREHYNQNDESGFVKTAQRPYDTVVVACLAVLKHRLGDAFDVSSDGAAADWIEGIEYARRVTGLKISNPIQPRAPRLRVA